MRQIGSALLLLVFTLSGCATNSESPCLAQDWTATGFADGRHGAPAAQLLSHQDVCLEQDVIPDRDAYLAGWRKGVGLYCQPDNGFLLGRQGADFESVCPANQQAEFYAAYREGRDLHQMQTDLHRLSQTLLAMQRELDRITSALESAQMPSPHAQPAATLAEHDQLREQTRLQTEIEKLKTEITRRGMRLSRQFGTLAAASG